MFGRILPPGQGLITFRYAQPQRLSLPLSSAEEWSEVHERKLCSLLGQKLAGRGDHDYDMLERFLGDGHELSGAWSRTLSKIRSPCSLRPHISKENKTSRKSDIFTKIWIATKELTVICSSATLVFKGQKITSITDYRLSVTTASNQSRVIEDLVIECLSGSTPYGNSGRFSRVRNSPVKLSSLSLHDITIVKRHYT